MNKSSQSLGTKLFSKNSRALYDYEVLDRVEAGIVLSGGEVKSIKSGQASIKEGYIHISRGEAWLWNAHVPRWHATQDTGYDPVRSRKLLMHRDELDKLAGKVKEKHLTLVPLKLYGVKGRIKVEVGLCRGRKKFEKRERERDRALRKELHEEKRKYMV